MSSTPPRDGDVGDPARCGNHECTDAALIVASLAEPARFGVIFERHATTIHRYLVRRVGPWEADTLGSEVFEIAFRRRAGFDASRTSARPWLYGIATNLIARHQRSEARRLRATARLAARPRAEPDLAVHVVEAQRTSDRFEAAAIVVGELPAIERDVLLLFAWEDLGYDEIAAALDIPVGTVRSRLHRARTRLRVADGDAAPHQRQHRQPHDPLPNGDPR